MSALEKFEGSKNRISYGFDSDDFNSAISREEKIKFWSQTMQFLESIRSQRLAWSMLSESLRNDK